MRPHRVARQRASCAAPALYSAMHRVARLFALLVLSGCRSAEPPRPSPAREPVTHTRYADLLAPPAAPADARIGYGDAPQQYGELRLPAGAGPHPVVVLVHGGCWRSAFDLRYAAPAAAALSRAGYATWLIEYRRIGDAGGWRGTFDDADAAVAFVARLAERHPVDPSRVVLAGHSAGGQLALYVAGRRRWQREGITVRGVVSLAGITDLAAYAAPSGCGSAVAPLLGEPADSAAARRALVSPIERGAVGVPVTMIHGADDPTVPPSQSRAFADAARAWGDTVTLRVVAGAGHFDVIDPTSPAWTEVLDAVARALGPRAP